MKAIGLQDDILTNQEKTLRGGCAELAFVNHPENSRPEPTETRSVRE